MKEPRLKYLLRQKIERNITEKEAIELAILLNEQSEKSSSEALEQVWVDFKATNAIDPRRADVILENILENKIHPIIRAAKKTKKRKYHLQVASIAASILLIAASALLFFENREQAPFNGSKTENKQEAIASPPAAYIRNITLPDGSKVVLNAKSFIKISPNFNRKTREISLSGEAYFDIAHDKTRPFIIHTGTVKTTVLGTAFNIKAWPESHNVVVSVTRGRVKVEKESELLAVLTVNQQVSFDEATTKSKKDVHVNAEKITTAWTKEDMNFDGETLANITNVLSKRYGVNISIDNEELANTQIVLSFNGTETIDNILDIICTINENTNYKSENGVITIYKTNN